MALPEALEVQRAQKAAQQPAAAPAPSFSPADAADDDDNIINVPSTRSTLSSLDPPTLDDAAAPCSDLTASAVGGVGGGGEAAAAGGGSNGNAEAAAQAAGNGNNSAEAAAAAAAAAGGGTGGASGDAVASFDPTACSSWASTFSVDDDDGDGAANGEQDKGVIGTAFGIGVDDDDDDDDVYDEAKQAFAGSPSSDPALRSLASECGHPPPEAAFSGWPDSPIVVRVHPGQRLADYPDADALRRLPVNTGEPFAVDTPLFSGRCALFVRGLPSSPPGLFEGSKRRSLIAVQGRFTRRVPLDALFTGQEFARPAQHLPPAWLVNGVLLRVARALCPSMAIGPMGRHVLMPVIAGAQALHVALPGQEPPLGPTPHEDARLLDASLVAPDGSPVSAAARKRHFSSAAARKGRHFDPGHTYTFYLYQHLVDLSTYNLHMPVKRFDLAKHLDGQPLRFMIKCVESNTHAVNLQIWHERLLPAARKAAAAEAEAEAAAAAAAVAVTEEGSQGAAAAAEGGSQGAAAAADADEDQPGEGAAVGATEGGSQGAPA